MEIYKRDADGFEVQDAANRGVEWASATYGGAFILRGPEVPTAEEVCLLKCKQCNVFLSEKLSAGFIYGGFTYQINGDAQDNIGKRATYAGWSNQDPITFPWVEPYSLGWWDISNTWHAMTANGFMLFAKAVSDYVSACAACCRNHKTAITPLNCQTFDYTTGWPVNQ